MPLQQKIKDCHTPPDAQTISTKPPTQGFKLSWPHRCFTQVTHLAFKLKSFDYSYILVKLGLPSVVSSPSCFLSKTGGSFPAVWAISSWREKQETGNQLARQRTISPQRAHTKRINALLQNSHWPSKHALSKKSKIDSPLPP